MGKSPKVDGFYMENPRKWIQWIQMKWATPGYPIGHKTMGSDPEKNGVVNFIQLPEDLHGRVLVRKLDVGDLWRCITHLEPHWSRLLQQTGPGTPGRHRNSMAMA